MSENEDLSETSSETQLLTAEYKDGQLQIVEVAPFDKGGELAPEGNDMPSLESVTTPAKYVQVVNPDKSVMQLDLLNLTLVRCEDGSESYRLVSSSEVGDVGTEATVTCVLHSSDNEEGDNGETYVMMEGGNPLVLYQSQPQPEAQDSQGQLSPQQSESTQTKAPKLTPNEILEKAKALQKAKANIVRPHARAQRGRKRKSELPPPHELLSSPNFKLFLYSCKFCSFKCNAIKEMSAHKAAAHSGGREAGGKWRARPAAPLQCALCPYRGSAHSQLMKHVQDIHSGETSENNSNKVLLDTAEVAAADVLVCGACGYESASRPLFRRHIETVHGATAC